MVKAKIVFFCHFFVLYVYTNNAESTKNNCIDLDETALKNLFSFIDDKSHSYEQDLRDMVAFKSVSATPESYNELIKVTQWTKNKLDQIGFSSDIKYLDWSLRRKDSRNDILFAKHLHHTDELGNKKFGPPFLFSKLSSALFQKRNNISLLVYGHLDVVPASMDDGWPWDPFSVHKEGKILFGRGITDNKGPVLAWINALKAMKELNICIPFEIKFFLENTEESGSFGIRRIFKQESDFFNNIDYAVISDNFCPNHNTPCLTYGMRGLAYFFVEIISSREDLHSGVYGGSVHESMQELIHIFARLSNATTGNILIPGIYDDVSPFTLEELQAYEEFDFDIAKYRDSIGLIGELLHPNKIEALQHKWRQPSLSIHGVEGAFYGQGSKTVIPHKVIGKFSIRLVPYQNIEWVKNRTIEFVSNIHRDMKTGNAIRIRLEEDAEPWITDPKNHHYRLASKAIKRVFGVKPDLTRDGGTVPATVYLSKILKNNNSLILLPLSLASDGAHSEHEHIDMDQYLKNVKGIVSYLYELNKYHGSKE